MDGSSSVAIPPQLSSVSSTCTLDQAVHGHTFRSGALLGEIAEILQEGTRGEPQREEANEPDQEAQEHP